MFFAPGEEGFELLLIFGVFCVPLVDGLFAALVDSGFPLLAFALVLGCFYRRVPGLVFGWLESGFERGSDACGVLGFVFGDLVSVDVRMVVGLFLVGSRVSAERRAWADAALVTTEGAELASPV